MQITCEHDPVNRRKIYTIILPDEILESIRLDEIDRQVIRSKIEHNSDILQSLQIIAFRHEQQYGSRLEKPETEKDV